MKKLSLWQLALTVLLFLFSFQAFAQVYCGDDFSEYTGKVYFSKSTNVDLTKLRNKINCLIAQIDSGVDSTYYYKILNTIAANYYRIGDIDASREFVRKIGKGNPAYLSFLLNDNYHTTSKSTWYLRPFYLNNFKDLLEDEFNIVLKEPIEKKVNEKKVKKVYCGRDYSSTDGVFYSPKNKTIDKKRIRKEIDCLENAITEVVDSSVYYKMQNVIAHYYYEIGEIDSTKVYIGKIAAGNPVFLTFLLNDNYYRTTTPTWPLQPYYLNNFVELLDKEYGIKLAPKKEKEKVVLLDDSALTKILQQISDKDQKYRGEEISDKINQARLDKENRIAIDSLFNIYGLPKDRDNKETFWIVFQHSTDCEWNKKWFIRFLDAYEANGYTAGWLKQTFKRFYHPETGYCRAKDAFGAAVFIQLLQEKYPKELGERFGYGEY